MNLGLLLPMGLVALAGVVVPLLIHLVRRPEQRIVDFPALRWLRESVRPRRRLRFEDPWLLAVRLLLLILLALLLAMPVLVGDWRPARHWIVLSSEVDPAAARREFTDSAAEWRWLAPDFPVVDAVPPAGSAQAFASLLREFDVDIPAADRLSVIVPAELHGLDAERLALTHEVDWRVIPAHIDGAATAATLKPRRVAIRHAGAESAGLAYLRAAVSAWHANAPEQWLIDDQASAATLSDNVDWLIWLDGPAPEALTPWITRGGRVLQVATAPDVGEIVWRDEDGAPIAGDRRIGSGHLVSLLRPLSPGELPGLLDADFPGRLRALFEDKPPPPTLAPAGSAQPLHVERQRQPSQTSLIALLGLLAAVLFLIERLLATRRRSAP
ncbi:MAG TPA: BatA domain-containing protein [Dokdonella sp.]|uniref:BatA domain-containing protein n=1 Tax=Dokdonella sp. TaxID=2291710 RepID=UPI002B627E38|nr:BatA domain-containing protein [Dokdonella sp.]HPG94452.1 BatA domain-containing protein [Dokdonella sp.]HPN79663.1 BatA domain-containing protein [Dokdonella sp.]